MPTALGHAAAAIGLSRLLNPTRNDSASRVCAIGIVCALLPDADVLAFRLGIPYGSVYGHRGATHSLAFALLSGMAASALLASAGQQSGSGRVQTATFLSICAASHGVLDAMTDGGAGVAFLAPFSRKRYFLPWRPIAVSPLSLANVFSSWGRRALLSELIWIGLPVLGAVAAHRLTRTG